MKRCLVTGAAGFVGANLVRRLLTEGHEVHLLLRKESAGSRLEAIRQEVQIHSVDLRDEEGMESAVRNARPDWVFHLAAYGAYSWQKDVKRILETNVLGTSNLLTACLETDFESIVSAGSSSEYGYKDHPPGEDTWLEPNSHYAVAKASATLLCRYTAQSRVRNIITLRLYSVYGPYEDTNRFMPTLIVKGLGNSLPRLVDPDIARDFVYVDDVCDAFVLAATVKNLDRGEVYNVGTGVQTTIAQMVQIAREEFGIIEEPRWGSMENRTWDTSCWVADNNRIRSRLDWQPRYDIRAGFRKMTAWFREHPEIAKEYAIKIQG